MAVKKIILGSLGFILLLVISEAIYQYNHPKLIIYKFFYSNAKDDVGKGKVQEAVNSLTTAANFTININKDKFHGLIPSDYKANIKLPNDSNLNRIFSEYINDLDFANLSDQGEYELPRVFYDLALLSYYNNQPTLFEPFLRIAYYFDPTLSYWPVELANYYYYSGDKNKAKNTLNECIQLPDPRLHCQNYLEYINSEGSVANKPGFLIDEMVKHYKFPSEVKKLSNL